MTSLRAAMGNSRIGIVALLMTVLGGAPASGQVNGTLNRVIKFTSPTTGGNSQLFDNGNLVGLGTTNPQDVLHLSRGSASTVGVLMGNSLVPAGRRGFLVDFHASGGAELWNFENTSMWFGTNSTRRMTIANDGDVGIGTSNPRDVLHLFRGSASTVGVLMGNGLVPAGQRRGFLVDFHGSGGAELWNFENTDMWFGTNGIKRVTIANDGRVGIGARPIFTQYFDGTILAPLLDVRGELRVENVPVWDGPDAHDLTWSAGFADGVAFSPDRLLISREGSSRRYKTEIQPAKEDYSKILAVEPKRYQMRQGYGLPGVSNFGYVAEDLDEAGLRNLVIYDKEGRPDGVAYKKVALYVNEVVKSQQKMIEQLQADVKALEERVRKLSEK